MGDQAVMRLQGDLDLDGPKLVDDLEERHDQELDHKVANMVPDHDSHIGLPVLDQYNCLMVARMDMVQDELWDEQKVEQECMLDQFEDPWMKSTMQWSTANIVLQHPWFVATALSFLSLLDLVDLVFLPVKKVIVIVLVVDVAVLVASSCLLVIRNNALVTQKTDG